MQRYIRMMSGVWMLLMMGPMFSFAQISPGPLSRAHSTLSGPTHCTDCHDVGRKSAEFKCLGCHKDISERLAAGRGLHPSLVGNDTSGRSCAKCHSEHNGLNFPVVHWDTPVNSFDHHRAGYTLEGKHAHLACRDCHRPAHISAAAREAISVKDLTRTYLGLSPGCLGCHADQHQGQLSTECAKCHDSQDWKNAAHFDHRRARFSLEGAHEKVACAKCHVVVQAAKPYVKYKGIAFEDCAPCHKDPHGGSFHVSCKDCHAGTGWKPFQVASVFNHGTTRYPLEGKHARVACESCHQHGDFKLPVAHALCSDCHKKDPHHGQFADRADKGECSDCHNVEGFRPSTFTVARHASTLFPLKARHIQVSCGKCHAADVNGVVYRIKDLSCASCHKDAHGGQFKDPPYSNRCEGCHTDRGFKKSTFTLAQHSKTRFPLEAAHEAVACTDCHKAETGAGSARMVRFRFDDRSCSACHRDPHGGQFVRRMAVVLADGSTAGCRACHTTRSWQELEGFDHAATEFPLEGAHRAVSCSQCHKTDNLTAEVQNIVYSSAPRQCSACHEDIHGGQFSSSGEPAQCRRCHQILKWKPSTFNHDTGSTYKLEGAHRTVRCALCHTTRKEVAGKEVVFYKLTPRQCSACHGSEVAGKQP